MPDGLVTTIARPQQLAGRFDAYAVYVPDDLNAPLVRQGHVAYIDPSRAAIVGGWVRVFPVNATPFIALLEARSDAEVRVKVASEAQPRGLATDAIDHMERVVGFMLLEI